MRYGFKWIAFFLAALLMAGPFALGETAPSQAAAEWLALAFGGELEAADAMLDAPMREALDSQGGLAAVVNALKAYGEVTAVGEPDVVEAGGYTVVTIPLTFENAALNAQVTVSDAGNIAGLYFLPVADDPDVTLARNVMEALATGRYEEADASFSPEMRAAMEGNGGTQVVMEALLADTGALLSIGTATKTQAQGYQVVVMQVAFENGIWSATLSIDANGQVAGLLLQPPVVVEDAVTPEGISETEVTVDAGAGYPLGGTLCAPEDTAQKLPAVLLVSGSGQNARDEIAGANRVFAQVAHGLAERGVISLRFDKRTYTYPALWNEPGFTVEQEYIQDVLAALEVLKADERVDASRVYIVGHSQGGMLAPRFVEEGADVAGLVLMAGTPRTLSDILYDQQMNVLSAALDQPAGTETHALQAQYDAWQAEAEALYAMTADDALAHAPLYDGTFPAYYLYDLQRHDALALLKEQKTPVLILQGSNDMQVFADTDYALYQAALGDEPFAEFRLYEGLNHLFMPSQAANLAEAMQEYNLPGKIPAEVLDDIAVFVRGE